MFCFFSFFVQINVSPFYLCDFQPDTINAACWCIRATRNTCRHGDLMICNKVIMMFWCVPLCYIINQMFILYSLGVYKASEARLLLLMYQVNYVNQGNQLKDSAITPAKIIEDSWTMDGFVSFSWYRVINLIIFSRARSI